MSALEFTPETRPLPQKIVDTGGLQRPLGPVDNSTLMKRATGICRAAALGIGILQAQTALGQRSVGSAARTAEFFHDVAISPDGKYIAWVGQTGQPAQRGLIVAEREGRTGATGVVRPPGADPESVREVVWSSDSHSLAFIAASAPDGVPTLYVVSASDRSARRIMAIPGDVRSPRFSPDGSRIALLYSSPGEQGFSPRDPGPRDTGLVGARLDRRHLIVVDLSTGTFKQLTPDDLYTYEFSWAPDGRRFVVSAAHGSGNNNWWIAHLYVISAESGDQRELVAPATQVAVPRWSPDGRQVAYIGGLMSDQGGTGGDVYTVSAAGGLPRNLTPGTRVSASSIAWAENQTLFVTGWARGGAVLEHIDPVTGSSRVLWSGNEWVTTGTNNRVPTISLSSDGGTAALVRESFSAPPEVWAGAIGQWTQLTHVNDGTPAPTSGVSVSWPSDSFDVQGWLLYPTDYDAGRRYPMIVDVHGGPASAWEPQFEVATHAALVRAGYFVFLPNPRGSFGFGEGFTRANVKDLGYGDLRDILAGVDTLTRRFNIDSARVGITGWSYGGYMSMWAVTQTGRFRAAVSGAGVSNWLSYTGENGISEWLTPYFGATAYDDPQIYAKSSPLTFIRGAHTPTLVVVGERDVACPAPQSFEFWRALRHVGAPTELVVYSDEGHLFHTSDHQHDVIDRMIRWFDLYLKTNRAS